MAFSLKAALARGRPDRKGYDKLSYEQHKERVRTMKPTIDTAPPRPHPLSNKRELEKRRKYAAIEYDNRLLLERLATIVQHKTIDNEMSKEANLHHAFRKQISVQKKKAEMSKITEQNHRLLRRIQEVPPAYNHLEWEEDAKHRENIKRILAMYPEYYERLEADKAKKSSGQTQKSYTSSSKSDSLWFKSSDGNKPSTGFLPPLKS